METRKYFENCLEFVEDLSGIYPQDKLACLEIARQKVREHTPRISEMAGVNLSLPEVKGTVMAKYACYFPSSQKIGIRLTKKNIKSLFPMDIDSTIIHELSHHLWWNSPGHFEKEGEETCDIWIEGFAEFLTTNFFSDLVPPNMSNSHSRNRIYSEGCIRAAYIAIFHNGSKDVFDIPRRWPEFEKEYQVFQKEEPRISMEIELADLEAAVKS